MVGILKSDFVYVLFAIFATALPPKATSLATAKDKTGVVFARLAKHRQEPAALAGSAVYQTCVFADAGDESS